LAHDERDMFMFIAIAMVVASGVVFLGYASRGARENKDVPGRK
jgi:hypothetical protein